ncbi:WXG100 family type VII secretion target [Frankia sp. Cj3]|uniref:WXG100 family type VII secretion target n=1 Tax=Frankia sp. Cj3 TaxID=2880976 RepID=UPI001EF5A3E7|nr:WXG100 family type VII secretion target [Frankia sp. Cj3]
MSRLGLPGRGQIAVKGRRHVNINIDYAQLESTAAKLDSARQEIETQLGQLKSMADTLVSDGFKTTQASGKLEASYQQWTTGAKGVIGGLDGMVAFLKDVVAQHQQLDQNLGQAAGG